MNNVEARNIGTAFLRNLSNTNLYEEGDKLGQLFDYNIFYSFPIVTKNGDFYIGGYVLLLDKRTSFCLVIASSPNFHDYHVKLFRIIILNQLYDSKIDLEEYQKKKNNIDYPHFIQAIFLLLESYPNHFNAYVEFLDILLLLDNEEHKDEIIQEFKYKSLSISKGTLDMFRKGLGYFKSNPVIISKVKVLNKLLLTKNLSIDSLG